MIIEAKACYFSYAGLKHPALAIASFSIGQQGIYGIAGKTGSGKSTFLKAIAGKIDIDKGKLAVFGEPVEGPSKRLLPNTEFVKLVAQQPDLFVDISVEENIKRHLLAYKPTYRKQKSDFLLRKVNLYAFRNRKISELSGGQQQLLGILCAIAEEPKLLLLDEPFTNLDFVSKSDLLQHLKTLINELAITTLFVSHDASDLLGFCDRIFVFKQGKIIDEGEPQTIFFNAQSDYTAGLFGYFSTLKKGKKTRYLRPSQFIPDKKGSVAVSILSIVFRGDFWEITSQTKIGTSIIFCVTKNDYSIGQQIKLRIID